MRHNDKDPVRLNSKDEMTGKYIARKAMKPMLKDECLTTEDIAAFADGSLIGAERDRIMDHLSSCSLCYEVFSETMKTLKDFGEQAEEKPQKDIFAVLKRVPFKLPLSLAAAAVLALVLKFSFQTNHSEFVTMAKRAETPSPAEQLGTRDLQRASQEGRKIAESSTASSQEKNEPTTRPTHKEHFIEGKEKSASATGHGERESGSPIRPEEQTSSVKEESVLMAKQSTPPAAERDIESGETISLAKKDADGASESAEFPDIVGYAGKHKSRGIPSPQAQNDGKMKSLTIEGHSVENTVRIGILATSLHSMSLSGEVPGLSAVALKISERLKEMGAPDELADFYVKLSAAGGGKSASSQISDAEAHLRDWMKVIGVDYYFDFGRWIRDAQNAIAAKNSAFFTPQGIQIFIDNLPAVGASPGLRDQLLDVAAAIRRGIKTDEDFSRLSNILGRIAPD